MAVTNLEVDVREVLRPALGSYNQRVTGNSSLESRVYRRILAHAPIEEAFVARIITAFVHEASQQG